MKNTDKKKRNNAYSAKKLAVCAMLCALGVVLLCVGSLIEVLDISMAVIASMLCIIAVIEYGSGAPWMIYGATSLLSLILIPFNTAATFYALFFGFYPILKEKFEKKQKVVSWLLKEAVFNVCLALMITTSILFLGLTDNVLVTPITVALLVIVAEIVFVVYDIALTRLITFYIIKLRSRLRFKK